MLSAKTHRINISKTIWEVLHKPVLNNRWIFPRVELQADPTILLLFFFLLSWCLHGILAKRKSISNYTISHIRIHAWTVHLWTKEYNKQIRQKNDPANVGGCLWSPTVSEAVFLTRGSQAGRLSHLGPVWVGITLVRVSHWEDSDALEGS
jgi:hypothetical protein